MIAPCPPCAPHVKVEILSDFIMSRAAQKLREKRAQIIQCMPSFKELTKWVKQDARCPQLQDLKSKK